MNPQLLLAVSQNHQQELRQAAREARMASQLRTRTPFALPRRFRVKAATSRPAPAISAQPGTV